MKSFLVSLLLCASTLAAPPCCSTNKVESGKITDKSIYQIETEWTSDFGKKMKLDRLRGKPQVIAMFFTSCEFACPVLVHDVRRIEAALPENLRTNVGFVLVTFDVQRDTVETLHAYREKLKLDSDRWLLLRGESEDIFELSALLGVKFKKDQRGQFAHSNIITILNPNGEIIHQQIGLNQDPAASVKALEQSLAPSLN
jgi:protein SCO1/2